MERVPARQAAFGIVFRIFQTTISSLGDRSLGRYQLSALGETATEWQQCRMQNSLFAGVKTCCGNTVAINSCSLLHEICSTCRVQGTLVDVTHILLFLHLLFVACFLLSYVLVHSPVPCKDGCCWVHCTTTFPVSSSLFIKLMNKFIHGDGFCIPALAHLCAQCTLKREPQVAHPTCL